MIYIIRPKPGLIMYIISTLEFPIHNRYFTNIVGQYNKLLSYNGYCCFTKVVIKIKIKIKMYANMAFWVTRLRAYSYEPAASLT